VQPSVLHRLWISVRQRDRVYTAHETARMLDLEGQPLASFRRRACAFFLDLMIAAFLFVAIGLPIALVWERMHPGRQAVLTFAPFGEGASWHSIVVFVAYMSISAYVTNGRPPGKRALGIRIVSTVHERLTFWHSLERALGYGVSAAEAGIGFLQYFVTANCRTTHDRIADTIVVDTRRGRAGHVVTPHDPASATSPVAGDSGR
jgi:uncharacterized RDD family membrane protein YckC